MAELTLTVDDDTLNRAHLRARRRNESVTAYLAESLRRYADAGEAETATATILTLAERSTQGSGPRGRTWTREELHDG